jgi:hypothetical protein
MAATLMMLLGYRSLLHRARPTRVVAERDQSDLRGLSSFPAKGSYDPYFNRVNFTPAASGTNAMTISNK